MGPPINKSSAKESLMHDDDSQETIPKIDTPLTYHQGQTPQPLRWLMTLQSKEQHGLRKRYIHSIHPENVSHPVWTTVFCETTHFVIDKHLVVTREPEDANSAAKVVAHCNYHHKENNHGMKLFVCDWADYTAGMPYYGWNPETDLWNTQVKRPFGENMSWHYSVSPWTTSDQAVLACETHAEAKKDSDVIKTTCRIHIPGARDKKQMSAKIILDPEAFGSATFSQVEETVVMAAAQFYRYKMGWDGRTTFSTSSDGGAAAINSMNASISSASATC